MLLARCNHPATSFCNQCCFNVLSNVYKCHLLYSQSKTFYADLQNNNIVENFQCVIICTHKRCCCTTLLIQNRGCRRYTFTQYTTSSKQRTCRTTIFINTFIVWLFAHKRCCCTTLTTLTHTEGVVHIYVYTVYNKQQTATGNFLAKKGAIRPSARCHFATNYQLFLSISFSSTQY